MPKEIRERTFDFSVRVLNMCMQLPEHKGAKILRNQVLRSGTSVGANVEEAESAYTKELFSYKMNIALGEARETHYWLRLLRTTDIVKPERLDPLIDEADQIKRVLGSIVSRTRGKKK